MRRGQFLCTLNHCFHKTVLVAQIGVTLKRKLNARIRRCTTDLSVQLVAVLCYQRSNKRNWVVVGKFRSEMKIRVEAFEYIEETFSCIESKHYCKRIVDVTPVKRLDIRYTRYTYDAPFVSANCWYRYSAIGRHLRDAHGNIDLLNESQFRMLKNVTRNGIVSFTKCCT